MKRDAQWIAEATGGRVVREGNGEFERATIDSREAGEGTLFVGLPGATADGGLPPSFFGAAASFRASMRFGVMVQLSRLPFSMEFAAMRQMLKRNVSR